MILVTGATGKVGSTADFVIWVSATLALRWDSEVRA